MYMCYTNGACGAYGANGACGDPVWTRSRRSCTAACAVAFVEDCVAPRVEEGADAGEAYTECQRTLDGGTASAWDPAGVCEDACVPTSEMYEARFLVARCVDYPFSADWSLASLNEKMEKYVGLLVLWDRPIKQPPYLPM